MLTDRGLMPSYVETMRRRADSMTKGGVDWVFFLRGPMEAKAAPRAFLADLKRRGVLSMVRACQKALNLLAAYVAMRDPRFAVVEWELAEPPKRRLNPYMPEEVPALAGAARDTFKGLRQQAMVWLLCNCIIRKTELAGLWREDFNQTRGGFVLREALKHGLPGDVLLPKAAWEPGNPLQAYTQARDALAGPTGPFWVRMDGKPLSKQGLAGDMHDLRLRSGVKANFNRFRHTRNTIMEEANVPLQVMQRENRHNDPKWTMWYAHGSLQRRRETLIQCRMPGYEDEPLGPPLAVKWARLGLPPTGAGRSRLRPVRVPIFAQAIDGVGNTVEARSDAPKGNEKENQRQKSQGNKGHGEITEKGGEISHGSASLAGVEGRSGSPASPGP